MPLSTVARRLGVAATTVHDWRLRDDRPLECWRLGRRWYTTEDALAEFARAGTEPAGSVPAAEAFRPIATAPRRRGADPDGDWCRARFARRGRNKTEDVRDAQGR